MKVYSVSEYRDELNDLLGQVTVAIQGEVTEFNISQNRFVWFSLADDTTIIKCFMMAFHLKVPIEDGMEIRVVGSPTMFKKGQVVFRPRSVELVGEGSLKLAYEALKRKLDAEGLFDADRKRELPRFPHRIGIVTSEGAAAYTDVLRILKNRWSSLEIMHANVNVQGAQAVRTIVDALAQLNHEEPDLDCIILTRGGGSLEDLHAFNDEEVVRAVFASKIPVVSGVGHERDTTLTDYVADVRASTPSNAAEIVVPDRSEIAGELEYMVQRMESTLTAQLRDHKEHINDTVYALESHARTHIDRFKQLRDRLARHFLQVEAAVQQKKQRASQMQQLLLSFNPENVLKRGYTMTTGPDGTPITSAAEAKKQETLVTRFADGEVQSTISAQRSLPL